MRYTKGPIGKVEVVEDFLPAPDELVPADGIKVTLALTRRSVEFFKREALKNNTQYQRMIRRLLDVYALKYTPAGSPKRGHRHRDRATRG